MGEASSVQYGNAVRRAIEGHGFAVTVETVVGGDAVLKEALASNDWLARFVAESDEVDAVAVADRVRSDGDPDSLIVGGHFLKQTGKQPLVHVSGKGRKLESIEDTRRRMQDEGLENVLVLTGDKLKTEYPRSQRPRYVESVVAVHELKSRCPDVFVAVAVNPFKYREEACMAQYLKLGRKAAAGADWAITQLGFDMTKFKELRDWVGSREYNVSLAANVMAMPARRARFIRNHKLAGVTITDSMLGLLEEEERSLDRGYAHAIKRLALQVVGLRLMGYRGVQLSGIGRSETLRTALDEIRRWQTVCTDIHSWEAAWAECWTRPNGTLVETVLPGENWYVGNSPEAYASAKERRHFALMEKMHSVAFEKGPLARAVDLLVKWVPRRSRADYALERIERGIKAPIFGCESCGMCRLAVTQYVCPETCPKGLANGACGGTDGNRCEFGDRECIHSVKYRIAKAAGRLSELEAGVVPGVPQTTRGTSSWPPHFRGETVSLVFPDAPKAGEVVGRPLGVDQKDEGRKSGYVQSNTIRYSTASPGPGIEGRSAADSESR